MERFSIDAVVIGAGIVGLATARALAQAGREVLILETADAIMTETSSRNSEVIHAGLYYPTGSLKAELCVAGKKALYAYLQARGLDYRPCGKLVVATNDEETAALADLARQAADNGVPETEILDVAAARAMEPELSADVTAALWSPTSGLFDSHGYALSLLGEAEDAGAVAAFGAPVVRGETQKHGVALETGGISPTRIDARLVVNAAGHRALEVARAIEGGPQLPVLQMRWCKGSYFSLSGRAPFQRLIYPTPNKASLGLHYTLDLGGRGRFGPDAEWLEADATPPFDYTVDPDRADLFYDAIRKYWPGLTDGALSADYAGVRPKLVGPGEAPADFGVFGPSDHGHPGLVHLVGIESPGLTASLALGALAAERAIASLA